MADGITLSPGGEIRITWKMPYNILMRPELESAIMAGSLKNLSSSPTNQKTRPSTGSRKSGFEKVSHCAQKRKKVEPGLSVIEQIILNFKLWMASAS